MAWRAVMAWSAIVALLTMLCASGPPVSSRVAVVLAVAVAAVVGFGARQSIVLAGLRAGTCLVRDDGSPPYSPLWVAASSMVGAAGLVGLATTTTRITPLLVVGLSGAGAIVCASAWPRAGTLRASSRSLWSYVLSGAALASILAAAMGAVVSVGRFGLEGQIAPGAFSRALAGTFLCDALVGVGGFVRAQAALERGVIRTSTTDVPDAPGPVLLAFLLAAPTVLFLPSVLPSLAATTAVGIKIVAGAIVGGMLHLAGGVRGASRALAHRQPQDAPSARSASTSSPE
jgi:hypothetical protein